MLNISYPISLWFCGGLYITVRDLGINMNQSWTSSDQLIKAHTFKWSTSTISVFSATDNINISQNRIAQRGGAQEQSQEVWAGSVCQLCEARQWVQHVAGVVSHALNVWTLAWKPVHSMAWSASTARVRLPYRYRQALHITLTVHLCVGFLLSTDRHSISPWPDPDYTPVCRLPSQYRQALHITLTGPWLYTCVPATEFSDFVCFNFHFVFMIRPQTGCSVVYKTCLYSFQITIFFSCCK